VKTVAIYGQIGSGKSEVARIFEKFGALVISADAIGHTVLDEDASVRDSLQKEFGSDILNKSEKVDRKLLASRAFLSDDQRDKLDNIVHPPLLDRLRSAIKDASDSGKYEIVAVDAALILKWEIQNEFDFLVCVTSSVAHRVDRLVSAGFAQDDAENRIASQIPSDLQAATADFIMDNDGTLENLRARAEEVYANIRDADFLD